MRRADARPPPPQMMPSPPQADGSAAPPVAVLDLDVRSIAREARCGTQRTNIRKVSSFFTKAHLEGQGAGGGVRFEAGPARCEVAERLLTVFRRYEDTIVQQYFWSKDFAQDFITLCGFMRGELAQQRAYFELRGPVHVFGDIHGNLEDLFFFRDKLWPAGMDVTAGKFLFLGDYVDRGLKGLEVLTYLFASKVCCPHKVFLLRGNHELRYVNGWEAHYRERSFLWQCKERFGVKLGSKVWEAANQIFDRLPLACSIDKTVFCSHGGMPRAVAPVAAAPDAAAAAVAACKDSRLYDMAAFPLPAALAQEHALGQMPNEQEQAALGGRPLTLTQATLGLDVLWSDPVNSDPSCVPRAGEQESPLLDAYGFGPGQRGGAAIMFGQRAVDDFLRNNGFSLMIRAHQASQAGISVAKNGKVITVFSTSKDHSLGDSSSCAYVLVEDQRVMAVNRVIEAPHPQPAHDKIAAQAAAPVQPIQIALSMPGVASHMAQRNLAPSPSLYTKVA